MSVRPFSQRLPADLAPNAVSRTVARLRAEGADVIDLTDTNPTGVGLEYPPALGRALAEVGIGTYDPDPAGLRDARAAIAAAYRADRGHAVDPERVILTASTSDAYSMIFKLLCDPGDSVLVPQPSYPLFDLLCRLDGVRAIPYRLEAAAAWAVDRPGVLQALEESTRAMLVVSPNNPTGSILSQADRDWIATSAAERGLAIVADEVFADYPLSPRPTAASMLNEARALTFTLGGLSKSAGLPQMKLAWVVVSGPDALVRPAIERLTVISDTYLSVGTPVQRASAALIAGGRAIRAQIARRSATNLACVRTQVRAYPAVTSQEPEGGWAAVLRLPSLEPEDALVIRLLEEVRVLVHPGYFFDFEEPSMIVVSLLPEPSRFAEGLARLLRAAGGARRV